MKFMQTYSGSLAKECISFINKKKKSVTGRKTHVNLHLLIYAMQPYLNMTLHTANWCKEFYFLPE